VEGSQQFNQSPARRLLSYLRLRTKYEVELSELMGSCHSDGADRRPCTSYCTARYVTTLDVTFQPSTQTARANYIESAKCRSILESSGALLAQMNPHQSRYWLILKEGMKISTLIRVRTNFQVQYGQSSRLLRTKVLQYLVCDDLTYTLRILSC
jgi:hypothetical protein